MGANELDMVINIGRLKDGDYDFVYEDICAVSTITKVSNLICKVIIETSLLTEHEKVKACLIAKEARADFVKTSTGFSKGGATAEDVALMKSVVQGKLSVKASGGIRSREDALKMISAGADRLGTSSGVKIILGEQASVNY
jgi:deoxyribose-phosphate aldolase